eukprot:6350715-Amphidinium_carterae.1
MFNVLRRAGQGSNGLNTLVPTIVEGSSQEIAFARLCMQRTLLKSKTSSFHSQLRAGLALVNAKVSTTLSSFWGDRVP